MGGSRTWTGTRAAFGTACMLLLGALLAGACTGGPDPVTSHGGPVRDHVALVDNLRKEGLFARPTGQVTQPFLDGASGTALEIGGNGVATTSIQSFEYPSPEAAQRAIAVIRPRGIVEPRSADGRIVHTVPTWLGTPHFFARSQVMVLYVGEDAAVLDLLGDLLGPELARP
jgi:hypothetical protein